MYFLAMGTGKLALELSVIFRMGCQYAFWTCRISRLCEFVIWVLNFVSLRVEQVKPMPGEGK